MGFGPPFDEGATIVTHESNKELIERAAKAPHTIKPDLLSVSQKPLKIRTLDTESTLTDGARTTKLYTMTGFEAHSGYAYCVPSEGEDPRRSGCSFFNKLLGNSTQRLPVLCFALQRMTPLKPLG